MSVATQLITDDLRRWIVAQTEAGCRPEDVLAAMHDSGWAEAVAAAALEQTLRERLAELDAETGAAAPAARASKVPEPDLAGAPAVLLAGGRQVRVLATLQRPRVVVFGGLLSDDECRGLMALAEPRLLRSETVDNATGGSEVNAARTSDGMFFERGEAPLITAVEQRIAELLRWPLDHGEGLQVLRYRPGAQYRPHHDYFDPAHPGTARILQRGGQRVGTLVMYLNAPEGGGATTFPDVGLEVAPVRGNAVFFSYDRAHPATGTLHGGAPVTAGEKWVATKWLREGVFV
ncbi:MAG: 2OG-Fe(II) oxygenase [Rubrivivax sp.]|jgi:prolyl 4-hydroxylase|nr:2OG-Fe(II) oxygenase [Betaproteobacteria bacterium]MBP6318006.1 2OG-Fe(II) oxygenase [Rubrivivax sp.]MBK7275606.1 2OG-Fe(II) oxygenase [Betaproteobacteria bacterium]MBK7514790.1 2OG-Fe(II) oxygenase [Betaproteobacteria bacterium]MBK8107276.1 2OG-Fe(II) oxygenase [Betaproteobacteria bacterium]